MTYVGWTLDLDRRLAEHNGEAAAPSPPAASLVAGLRREIPHPAKGHGAGICLEAGPRLPRFAAVALIGLFWQGAPRGERMIFEQIATGGCQSYLLGCEETHAAILIDPNLKQIDHYLGLAARDGLAHQLCAGHPHPCRPFLGGAGTWPRLECAGGDASAVAGALRRFPPVRRRNSARRPDAPDARCTRPAIPAIPCAWWRKTESLPATRCLIGGTGRTDLPTGDPEALYDSLFNRLLKLDPKLKVYPAHDYKGRSHSTIGEEIAGNPAAAETRPRRIRGHDAYPQSGSTNPPDRSAAHQYERRQDRGADAVGRRRQHRLHFHGRIGGTGEAQRSRTGAAGCAGERRLRRRSHSRRPASAARATGIARQHGIARSHPAHSGVLRVRPYLDPGRRHLARAGLYPRHGAGWRHQILARKRSALSPL